MILHILNGNSHFARKIQRYWESSFPGRNVFVIGSANAGQSPHDKGFDSISTGKEVADLIRKHAISCVVFNGLTRSDYSDAIPSHIITGWVCWGYELYGPLHRCMPTMIEPKTRHFFHRHPLSCAKQAVKFLGDRFLPHSKDFFSFTSRLDFFGSQLEGEFDFLRRNAPVKPTLVHLKAPVYMLSDIIDLQGCARHSHRPNIQVGNSATPTNNHADAFHFLKKMDLSDRLVYVPLGYGFADYRDFVVRTGRKLLGSRFVPMMDFLSLNDYNDSLSSCGYVVMNHHRQQAVGNIIAALVRGSKVFLGPNFIYPSYKARGLSVFRFPSEFNLDAFDASELAKNNTRILQGFIGDEAAVAALRTFAREHLPIP